MVVFHKIVQLFRIDGETFRKVWAGKKDAAHVNEEGVAIGPFQSLGKLLITAERLVALAG